MFFFFSSRRRHTRLQGDWSSDVCSSDLLLVVESAGVVGDDRVRHVATREVCGARRGGQLVHVAVGPLRDERLGVYLQRRAGRERDRKSTRLNSSHLVISYAVFCLKKKKKTCIRMQVS